MLSDRYTELSKRRIQTVNRLHRLLAELVPGTRKKDLSALQAKAILAKVAAPGPGREDPPPDGRSRRSPTWSGSMPRSRSSRPT